MNSMWHRRRSRKQLMRMFGSSCYYCGTAITIETATIDHKTPVSRGGKHSKDNIVIACKPCNQSKDDMTDQEFIDFIKEGPNGVGAMCDGVAKRIDHWDTGLVG